MYESSVVDFKWPTYSEKEPRHLLLNVKTEMKKDLSLRGYNFWDNIYQKYYWTPKAPVPPKSAPVRIRFSQDQESTSESRKSADNKKGETKAADTEATETEKISNRWRDSKKYSSIKM